MNMPLPGAYLGTTSSWLITPYYPLKMVIKYPSTPAVMQLETIRSNAGADG
jgi:hypothetical protein